MKQTKAGAGLAAGARTALAVVAGFGMTYGAALALAESLPAKLADAPPAEPRAEANTSAPTPKSRAEGGAAGEPMAAHADPVASYTLRASLDPTTHQIRGEGTIVWRNASSVPLRELWLHLYLNAFKNERTNYLRQRARGFRGGGALSDYGWIRVSKLVARELDGADLWSGADRHTPGDPEDETDIRVPLPRAIEPGQTLTLDVAWVSDLPSVTLRTGHEDSFHMVAQWFPKLAKLEPDGRWAHFPFYRFSEFYADYGTYDVTIDAPEAFVVGATGRLEKETTTNGRIERRFVQEDVHDFAFTAWDKFRDVSATTADGVALRCLYPPGHDRVATIELDSVRYGLEHLGAAYGKYPYSTVTIVHPPRGAEEAGGMEYPTLITTGGEWYSPETGARNIEAVTIHELGHQWFYGLVATNEHAFPFIDEGLNSYAEGMAMEARWPNASAANLFGVLSIALPSAFRAPASEVEHNEIVAQSAARFATGSDYGSLVYSRTATILLTLGNVYGKERVQEAIGRYTRRYRFRHPGPEELIGVVREVVGPEAATTLRAALFERAWVDYAIGEVSSSREEPPGGVFGDPDKPSDAPAVKDLYRSRVLVRRRGTLVFPVTIELIGDDGSRSEVTWDGQGSTHEIELTGDHKIVAAIVDPQRRVLLDDDLLDNAASVRGRFVAPRVLERGTFAAELFLHLLGP
jgi:hypothetical protein